MKFKQYENGSCDIEFSVKERWLILKKGKIHLSDEALRHFGPAPGSKGSHTKPYTRTRHSEIARGR